MASKITNSCDGSRSPNVQPPVPLTPREQASVDAIASMHKRGILPTPASPEEIKKIKAARVTHVPTNLKPIPMPKEWEKKLCHNNP